MGWQDDPLVDQSQGQTQQPAWMKDPLVGAQTAPQTPGGQIAQPADTLPGLDPRTATLGDYLAKLHQAGAGLGQIGSAAANYARVAANTYGQGNSLLASLKSLYPDLVGAGGPQGALPGNLAAEKAKTETAKQDLGTPGTIAASMTGAGPLASVGKGLASAATPYVGRYFGGVLGSAATNAGATTAGEIGRGDPLSARDIALSALIGTAAGAVPGVSGRGGTLEPPVPISQLAANKEGAFNAAGDVLYNNADLRQATTNALDAIRNQADRVTEQGGGAIGALNAFSLKTLGKGARSAEDINDLVKSLKQDATGDKVPTAGLIAQQHFNDVLNNVQPIASPSHIPLAPGAGATAIDQANEAFQRLANSKLLQTMENKAAEPGGRDIGTQMSNWLQSNEGQSLIQSGALSQTTQDAFRTLAGTRSPAVSMAPSEFVLRHALYHLAPAIALPLAGSAYEGHFDPAHMAAEAAAGLAVGYGAHVGLPKITSMIQGPAQQRALAAARTAASTGLPQAPVFPDVPFRDAMRQLLYSQAAAGRY